MEPETDYFQQCKYIHEVELVNMRLQMRILETHLETKDRLIRNLEDIIDEQEARIHNMEEFINGHASSYVSSMRMLKGISVLSVDFGMLSDENQRLKIALAHAQRQDRIGLIVETDEDYESDMTEERRMSPKPEVLAYSQMAKSIVDDGNLKKLQRIATELKAEKNELKQLALDTKDAFSICMQEVRMMLESKTVDFFRVLIGRYKAEMEKRKQLHNQLVEMNGNIRVFYRIRPQLGKITELPALEVDSMDTGMVHLKQPTGSKICKSADRVIPTSFSQEQIFEEVSPIITSCIDGYNVCIFAFGHTGSGKTYTMEGPSANPGINQRAIRQLFEAANEKSGDVHYSISVSMMEIYNEKLRDLLNVTNATLSIRQGENGQMSIPGLKMVEVESTEHVAEVLQEGKKNKAIAATDANAESSRSHVIVRVTVTARNKLTEQISTDTASQGPDGEASEESRADWSGAFIWSSDFGCLRRRAGFGWHPGWLGIGLGSSIRVAGGEEHGEAEEHDEVELHPGGDCFRWRALGQLTGQSKRASYGHLNLVDLAGSERVSQTNATGKLLKEAQAINKSLSELGNVVLALRQNQRHIPFRNCQLTRILEDSLNGDSKTLVIVHLSPDSKHVTESVSSMNFAEKIGCVQTKSGTLKRDSAARRSTTGTPKKTVDPAQRK